MPRDPFLIPRDRRGRVVAPFFLFSTSRSNRVRARSKITAGSPSRISRRSRSWTCQHRAQHAHRGQVDGPIGQAVEDDRESPHRTRRGVTVVGGILRKTQLAAAVVVQRARPFAEMDSPAVKLREMRDELDGGVPFQNGE